MKLGVVFPQIEFSTDTALVRDYIQTAEGLGYDYFLVYDHVLGANRQRAEGFKGPYDHHHPFREPFTLFAYLSAITQRIEFVTGILILPQRQTALVAKQAAEVDLLSGGRLRLGIGIGWNKVEYDALGQDFSTRGKRSEEQIEVLRALWTQPLVNYQGRYETIPDAGLNPLPLQRPIPIWFGGYAEPVLKRMARLGDGWLPAGTPRDKIKHGLELIHAEMEKHGRDPQTFGLDVHIPLDRTPQADWEKTLHDWRDFGATHAAISTMYMGLSPAEHIAKIRTFRETLGDLSVL